MSRYRVLEFRSHKDVAWDVNVPSCNPKDDYPTLEEINEAAEREFPGTPKDKLMIFDSHDQKEIFLRKIEASTSKSCT